MGAIYSLPFSPCSFYPYKLNLKTKIRNLTLMELSFSYNLLNSITIMKLQKLKDLQNPKNQLTKEELILIKGGIGCDDIEAGIGNDDIEST